MNRNLVITSYMVIHFLCTMCGANESGFIEDNSSLSTVVQFKLNDNPNYIKYFVSPTIQMGGYFGGEEGMITALRTRFDGYLDASHLEAIAAINFAPLFMIRPSRDALGEAKASGANLDIYFTVGGTYTTSENVSLLDRRWTYDGKMVSYNMVVVKTLDQPIKNMVKRGIRFGGYYSSFITSTKNANGGIALGASDPGTSYYFSEGKGRESGLPGDTANGSTRINSIGVYLGWESLVRRGASMTIKPVKSDKLFKQYEHSTGIRYIELIYTPIQSVSQIIYNGQSYSFSMGESPNQFSLTAFGARAGLMGFNSLVDRNAIVMGFEIYALPGIRRFGGHMEIGFGLAYGQGKSPVVNDFGKEIQKRKEVEEFDDDLKERITPNKSKDKSTDI